MTIVLLVIHVLVCLVLIVSILLQSGKGGGLAGGAFGGMGGSSAVFGGTGAATFLSKVTTYLAIVFFLTCIGLWYSSRSGETLPETAAERALKAQGPVPLNKGPLQPVGADERAAPAGGVVPAHGSADSAR